MDKCSPIYLIVFQIHLKKSQLSYWHENPSIVPQKSLLLTAVFGIRGRHHGHSSVFHLVFSGPISRHRIVKNRIPLSEFDGVWISSDTWFLVLIISSTFLKFPWRREVIQVGTGRILIPADTVNLHWQKDNSNDIHLISVDRFRTCFSLTQKWIREQ